MLLFFLLLCICYSGYTAAYYYYYIIIIILLLLLFFICSSLFSIYSSLYSRSVNALCYFSSELCSRASSAPSPPSLSLSLSLLPSVLLYRIQAWLMQSRLCSFTSTSKIRTHAHTIHWALYLLCTHSICLYIFYANIHSCVICVWPFRISFFCVDAPVVSVLLLLLYLYLHLFSPLQLITQHCDVCVKTDNRMRLLLSCFLALQLLFREPLIVPC